MGRGRTSAPTLRWTKVRQHPAQAERWVLTLHQGEAKQQVAFVFAEASRWTHTAAPHREMAYWQIPRIDGRDEAKAGAEAMVRRLHPAFRAEGA